MHRSHDVSSRSYATTMTCRSSASGQMHSGSKERSGARPFTPRLRDGTHTHTHGGDLVGRGGDSAKTSSAGQPCGVPPQRDHSQCMWASLSAWPICYELPPTPRRSSLLLNQERTGPSSCGVMKLSERQYGDGESFSISTLTRHHKKSSQQVLCTTRTVTDL